MGRGHRCDRGFVNVLKRERVFKCNPIRLGVQLNLGRCGESEPIASKAAVTPVSPVLVIDKAADTVNIDPVAAHFHFDAHVMGNIIPSGGTSVEYGHDETIAGLSHS
ncbi:hypothetical protein D3C77_568620 [compost metagenome]